MVSHESSPHADVADLGNNTRVDVKEALRGLDHTELTELIEEVNIDRAQAVQQQAVQLWNELSALNEQHRSLTSGPLPLPPFAGNRAQPSRRSSRWSPDQFTKAVLECLDGAAEGVMGTAGIRDFVVEQGGSGNTLSQQHLPRLVAEELIEQPARGRYCLTEQGKAWLDRQSSPASATS